MDPANQSRRACSQSTFLHGYLQGIKAKPSQHKHRKQPHIVTIGRLPKSGQAAANVSGRIKSRNSFDKTADASRASHQLFPKHKKQAGEPEFAAARQQLAKKAASQVRKLGPVQHGGLQIVKTPLPEPFTIAADRILVSLDTVHPCIPTKAASGLCMTQGDASVMGFVT